MIITISGKPGSGKTTLAKNLAKELDYDFYSMGDIREKMALERGMTIDELNNVGMKEEWTDKEVDEYQQEIAEQEDNIIIESRLGWYFIEKSIDIFLDVEMKTAAERIFQSQKKGERKDEKKYNSEKEVKQVIEKRIKSDKKRYKKYYGKEANFLEKENYDIIIDTTKKSKKELLEKTLEEINKTKRLL